MSLPYSPGAAFAIPPAALQRLVDQVFAETARRPAVMIAIEDEALRDETRRLLLRARFTVVELDSGALSAATVGSHVPDAVLADARTLDGWAAVGRMREDAATSGVPVVALVAAPREPEQGWARRFGVECLVPVPFDPDGLVDLMERVTGS